MHPDSPCIDSGNPENIDLDGTRRDIGAITFINNSSNLIGDCNNDSFQNIIDVIFIINNCILSNSNTMCDCSDINLDGQINILDVVNLIDIILTN